MRMQQAVKAMTEYREACRARLAEKQAAVAEMQAREQAEAAARRGPALPNPILEVLVLPDSDSDSDSEGEVELQTSESTAISTCSDPTTSDGGGYETISSGEDESMG